MSNYSAIKVELNPTFVAGYKIHAECRRYLPANQRWNVKVVDGFEYKTQENQMRVSKIQARNWIEEKTKEYQS